MAQLKMDRKRQKDRFNPGRLDFDPAFCSYQNFA